MTKERKNPSEPRKDRTVVERGYFHTGNSGISISMVEESENYDWDEQDRSWYNHYLEIRHSAFGAGTSVRTPIAGPTMCDYYITAFTRLRDRMLADPLYRLPTVFERYNHPGLPDLDSRKKRSDDNYRIVDIENGLRREEVWSDEIVVDEYSTETRLMGHNYVDPKTEKFVKFVPFEGEVVTGSSGCGGSPVYFKEAIGKPVAEAKNVADEAIRKLKIAAGIEKPAKPFDDKRIEGLRATMTEGQKKLGEKIIESIKTGNTITSATVTHETQQESWLQMRTTGKVSESDEDIAAIDKAIAETVENIVEANGLPVEVKIERPILSVKTPEKGSLKSMVEGPFEGETRLLKTKDIVRAIQWMRDHDSFGTISYGGTNVRAEEIELPGLIADSMSNPDAESKLWVSLTTIIAAAEFTRQFG
jgi:hypothetical protein